MSTEERLREVRVRFGKALAEAGGPIGDDYVEEAVSGFAKLYQPMIVGPDGRIVVGVPGGKDDPQFVEVTEFLREFWTEVIEQELRFTNPEWRRSFARARRADPRRAAALKALGFRLRNALHPATWVAMRRAFLVLEAMGELTAALKERLVEANQRAERAELEEEVGLLRACDTLVHAIVPFGKIILTDDLRFRIAEAAIWFEARRFQSIARRLNQLVEMKQGYLDPLGAARPRTSGTRQIKSLDPAPSDAETSAPRLLDWEPAPAPSPLDILIHREAVEFLKAYLLEHDDCHWRATKAYLRRDFPSRQEAADAFGSTPDRIRSREAKLTLYLNRLTNPPLS